MPVNDTIFKELIKRGHSKREKTRVWDISDSKLWYLTPELIKGFLNLKQYEPYRRNIVDLELELIERNSEIIYEFFGHKKFNLVDLGGGNGKKVETFIKKLPDTVQLRYCPIDFNEFFVKNAVKKIKDLKSKKVADYKEYVSSDYNDIDEVISMLRNGEYQRNLILLLSETISHYDINDFLYTLSNSMFSGDMIVIGNGIRTGERFVNIEKYKVPLFNDWFIHIMKGLGFSEKEVAYDARFTDDRLEGFYKILVDKTIEYKGKQVEFKKGDEVIVAVQYKYFAPELKKFCRKYFRKVELITDNHDEYALAVCIK